MTERLDNKTHTTEQNQIHFMNHLKTKQIDSEWLTRVTPRQPKVWQWPKEALNK